MSGLPVRCPVVQQRQRDVRVNVATGPKPAASGAAAKPVQVNLRDEGFDGMLCLDCGGS